MPIAEPQPAASPAAAATTMPPAVPKDAAAAAAAAAAATSRLLSNASALLASMGLQCPPAAQLAVFCAKDFRALGLCSRLLERLSGARCSPEQPSLSLAAASAAGMSSVNFAARVLRVLESAAEDATLPADALASVAAADLASGNLTAVATVVDTLLQLSQTKRAQAVATAALTANDMMRRAAGLIQLMHDCSGWNTPDLGAAGREPRLRPRLDLRGLVASDVRAHAPSLVVAGFELTFGLRVRAEAPEGSDEDVEAAVHLSLLVHGGAGARKDRASWDAAAAVAGPGGEELAFVLDFYRDLGPARRYTSDLAGITAEAVTTGKVTDRQLGRLVGVVTEELLRRTHHWRTKVGNLSPNLARASAGRKVGGKASRRGTAGDVVEEARITAADTSTSSASDGNKFKLGVRVATKVTMSTNKLRRQRLVTGFNRIIAFAAASLGSMSPLRAAGAGPGSGSATALLLLRPVRSYAELDLLISLGAFPLVLVEHLFRTRLGEGDASSARGGVTGVAGLGLGFGEDEDGGEEYDEDVDDRDGRGGGGTRRRMRRSERRLRRAIGALAMLLWSDPTGTMAAYDAGYGRHGQGVHSRKTDDDADDVDDADWANTKDEERSDLAQLNAHIACLFQSDDALLTAAVDDDDEEEEEDEEEEKTNSEDGGRTGQHGRRGKRGPGTKLWVQAILLRLLRRGMHQQRHERRAEARVGRLACTLADQLAVALLGRHHSHDVATRETPAYFRPGGVPALRAACPAMLLVLHDRIMAETSTTTQSAAALAKGNGKTAPSLFSSLVTTQRQWLNEDALHGRCLQGVYVVLRGLARLLLTGSAQRFRRWLAPPLDTCDRTSTEDDERNQDEARDPQSAALLQAHRNVPSFTPGLYLGNESSRRRRRRRHRDGPAAGKEAAAEDIGLHVTSWTQRVYDSCTRAARQHRRGVDSHDQAEVEAGAGPLEELANLEQDLHAAVSRAASDLVLASPSLPQGTETETETGASAATGQGQGQGSRCMYVREGLAFHLGALRLEETSAHSTSTDEMELMRGAEMLFAASLGLGPGIGAATGGDDGRELRVPPLRVPLQARCDFLGARFHGVALPPPPIAAPPPPLSSRRSDGAMAHAARKDVVQAWHVHAKTTPALTLQRALARLNLRPPSQVSRTGAGSTAKANPKTCLSLLRGHAYLAAGNTVWLRGFSSTLALPLARTSNGAAGAFRGMRFRPELLLSFLPTPMPFGPTAATGTGLHQGKEAETVPGKVEAENDESDAAVETAALLALTENVLPILARHVVLMQHRHTQPSTASGRRKNDADIGGGVNPFRDPEDQSIEIGGERVWKGAEERWAWGSLVSRPGDDFRSDREGRVRASVMAETASLRRRHGLDVGSPVRSCDIEEVEDETRRFGLPRRLLGRLRHAVLIPHGQGQGGGEGGDRAVVVAHRARAVLLAAMLVRTLARILRKRWRRLGRNLTRRVFDQGGHTCVLAAPSADAAATARSASSGTGMGVASEVRELHRLARQEAAQMFSLILGGNTDTTGIEDGASSKVTSGADASARFWEVDVGPAFIQHFGSYFGATGYAQRGNSGTGTGKYLRRVASTTGILPAVVATLASRTGVRLAPEAVAALRAPSARPSGDISLLMHGSITGIVPVVRMPAVLRFAAQVAKAAADVRRCWTSSASPSRSPSPDAHRDPRQGLRRRRSVPYGCPHAVAMESVLRDHIANLARLCRIFPAPAPCFAPGGTCDPAPILASALLGLALASEQGEIGRQGQGQGQGQGHADGDAATSMGRPTGQLRLSEVCRLDQRMSYGRASSGHHASGGEYVDAAGKDAETSAEDQGSTVSPVNGVGMPGAVAALAGAGALSVASSLLARGCLGPGESGGTGLLQRPWRHIDEALLAAQRLACAHWAARCGSATAGARGTGLLQHGDSLASEAAVMLLRIVAGLGIGCIGGTVANRKGRSEEGAPHLKTTSLSLPGLSALTNGTLERLLFLLSCASVGDICLDLSASSASLHVNARERVDAPPLPLSVPPAPRSVLHAIGARLAELDLSHCSVRASLFAPSSSSPSTSRPQPLLPRLSLLRLRCCLGVDTAVLKSVAESCPQLRHLDLSGIPFGVTDEGLATLARCGSGGAEHDKSQLQQQQRQFALERLEWLDLSLNLDVTLRGIVVFLALLKPTARTAKKKDSVDDDNLTAILSAQQTVPNLLRDLEQRERKQRSRGGSNNSTVGSKWGRQASLVLRVAGCGQVMGKVDAGKRHGGLRKKVIRPRGRAGGEGDGIEAADGAALAITGRLSGLFPFARLERG